MKHKIPLFLVLVFGLTSVACERTARECAGAAKQIAGAPVYTATAQISAVPAAACEESVMPKSALDGQALFTKVCAACHQATGQGIPGAFPPLDASPYVLSDNVSRMASIMIYGLQGPINVNGNVYNNVMAPQGALKDEELAAIATYVRGAWSNKAAAVEPAVFAEARKTHGARGPFSIAELGEEK